jgi:SNF family Na+-dependent transporter
MLDANNNPTVSSSIVTAKGNLLGVRLKFDPKNSLAEYSIPQNLKAAGSSTFALSVGYHNQETRAVFTDTDDMLPSDSLKVPQLPLIRIIS